MGAYRTEDGRRLCTLDAVGDGGNVGHPRDNVLRERAVDGEAAIFTLEATWSESDEGMYDVRAVISRGTSKRC